ncbi:hypothetical protein SAMN02910358_02113 [Lachnospiraceae bacterium XBB1006]|nr:hypothetical protein SAMN02910358_02113 [Lachnospiraceae bacterium XBB1006]
MSRQTRLIVLHMKEVMYTIVFVALFFVLLILLFLMFQSDKSDKQKAAYVPGIYSAPLAMKEGGVEVEVVLDANRINAIRFHQLSEEVATMYPLMQPCLDTISQQIYETQDLKKVKVGKDGSYTSHMILKAIHKAVNQAKIQ